MPRRRAPYSRYLLSKTWARIRQQTLRHYKHRCMVCGATGVDLEVHHAVYPRTLGTEPLYTLTTLCEPCHAYATMAMVDRKMLENYPGLSAEPYRDAPRRLETDPGQTETSESNGPGIACRDYCGRDLVSLAVEALWHPTSPPEPGERRFSTLKDPISSLPAPKEAPQCP
jgi:hypothetical protein